jgi:hypothetical protein
MRTTTRMLKKTTWLKRRCGFIPDTSQTGPEALRPEEASLMEFGHYAFGSIEIDGKTYERDVIIDHGRIRNRKKGPSKPFRSSFGHTPLSVGEDIPWDCRRLVVGSGAGGALPVMEEVRDVARHRGVELVVLPTAEAIALLRRNPSKTNAILHLTC